MNVSTIENSSQFKKVQTQMRRRLVKLRFGTREVEISRAGGHYRARFEGGSDCAIGSDPHQAVQRLHKLPNMVRSVCVPKYFDIALDKAEQAAERAAIRANRHSHQFEPRG